MVYLLCRLETIDFNLLRDVLCSLAMYPVLCHRILTHGLFSHARGGLQVSDRQLDDKMFKASVIGPRIAVVILKGRGNLSQEGCSSVKGNG